MGREETRLDKIRDDKIRRETRRDKSRQETRQNKFRRDKKIQETRQDKIRETKRRNETRQNTLGIAFSGLQNAKEYRCESEALMNLEQIFRSDLFITPVSTHLIHYNPLDITIIFSIPFLCTNSSREHCFSLQVLKTKLQIHTLPAPGSLKTQFLSCLETNG